MNSGGQVTNILTKELSVQMEPIQSLPTYTIVKEYTLVLMIPAVLPVNH